MKTGVSTTPRASSRVPARAAPSVALTVNFIEVASRSRLSLPLGKSRVRDDQNKGGFARALPHRLRIVLADRSIGRYKGRSIKGGLRNDQAVENVARPVQIQGLFGDRFQGPVLDRESYAPLQFGDYSLRGRSNTADLAQILQFEQDNRTREHR